MGNHVAIWDERLNDYKWYSVAAEQRDFKVRIDLLPTEWSEHPKRILPNDCVEITYNATGRFVTRGDGELAEIFE